MTFPSNLATLVNELAVTAEQVSHFERLLTKVREEEKRLRADLLNLLDQAGFTEEAVELLLAARK